MFYEVIGNHLFCYISRFNDVVVGGTKQTDNWDTTVNDSETQAIIERAAEFEPTIKVRSTLAVGNEQKHSDLWTYFSYLTMSENKLPKILFLQNAVLIKAWVGLRPGRDSVRLEKEIMQVSPKYGIKMTLQVTVLIVKAIKYCSNRHLQWITLSA
jgi:hypothetical protein